MGDTGLLPGSVIDKFAFRDGQRPADERVREDQGPAASRTFEDGKIVSKEAFEEERARLEADGKKTPTWDAPHAGDVRGACCWASPRRRCSRTASSRAAQLPGDDQGADRGGPGRQGRLPGRPEGERDPGPPDPGGHRLPACTRTPRCGSTPLTAMVNPPTSRRKCSPSWRRKTSEGMNERRGPP